MSNSSNQQGQPWWHREKKDSLPERIQNIQKVNDPSTYTDEVLRGSKVLLVLLLCFSGVLGGLSYLKNFEISFPFEVALFLAVVMTVVIEWGKNKAATWAVRIPFFQGWSYTWQTPANTVIFGGLILVAVATFTMSVYNSTKGGEQLAQMLSHEKNSTVFLPDTKAIDEQIANTQKSVSEAPLVTWKGKKYYQSEKTVRAQSKSLESLQRQREESVRMQRADYEQAQSVKGQQTNFAARLVLASGGWIEVLQIILIFLRVACEKNLDGRTSTLSNHSTARKETPAPAFASTPIGFNLDRNGNVRSIDNDSSVSQLPQSVTQTMMSPDEMLRWFEQELRREPSNLNNKHANAETVIKRIHGKLSRAEQYIAAVESLPEKPAGRFKNYLEAEMFPIIDGSNPYPRKTDLINLITLKTRSSNEIGV